MNIKPNQPVHGTRSRYRKGCRCRECTDAERNYRRRYRAEVRFAAARRERRRNFITGNVHQPTT